VGQSKRGGGKECKEVSKMKEVGRKRREGRFKESAFERARKGGRKEDRGEGKKRKRN